MSNFQPIVWKIWKKRLEKQSPRNPVRNREMPLKFEEILICEQHAVFLFPVFSALHSVLRTSAMETAEDRKARLERLRANAEAEGKLELTVEWVHSPRMVLPPLDRVPINRVPFGHPSRLYSMRFVHSYLSAFLLFHLSPPFTDQSSSSATTYPRTRSYRRGRCATLGFPHRLAVILVHDYKSWPAPQTSFLTTVCCR